MEKVSIPQSGFGAFELVGHRFHCCIALRVSIPQSGFGAFELILNIIRPVVMLWFQSLSRDSGHLNSSRRRRQPP